MLTINENDNIIFSNDEETWDLSDAEDYKAFLIWVTSPNEDVVITTEMFDVDPAILEDKKDRAVRYSDFLKVFAQKRVGMIEEHKKSGLDYKSHIESMERYIETLSIEDE